MHRAGEAVDVAQSVLVVRCEDDHPDIGTVVLNADLDEVGRVVDVFGPVDRPFLAVTPEGGVHPAALVGSTLYAR